MKLKKHLEPLTITIDFTGPSLSRNTQTKKVMLNEKKRKTKKRPENCKSNIDRGKLKKSENCATRCSALFSGPRSKCQKS